MPETVYQKLIAAAEMDASDHKGRVIALYRGEEWAVREMSDMRMVEFFWTLHLRRTFGMPTDE